MIITNAKYEEHLGEKCGIEATTDGEVCHIPLDPANRHYAEIMRQVEAGTLTILAAD
jgi:hypothetical protein